MTLYLDSSALVKRYVDEPENEHIERLMLADVDWVTGNHTYPEVVRTLHRRLGRDDRADQRLNFEADWARTHVVQITDGLCRRAADIATRTGTRTLDALHLAAVEHAGGATLTIVTFDNRLAEAARDLAFVVTT